ncbi:hypothetical protein MtrunA17_Chr5g0413501 [Medicago truncatula]|uniref:Transmembrane protein, putative n=1 Tax=Medicago truncatula TaxID=3880 RepID=G7K1C9_MEDTR|nr:uncharacterized protein LOC11409465 [Medicago truncatula]AES96182.1 transmembrane protein, putative [Medicago truncatula]AFK48243.1 unknown [Medicago truncatula]RHN55049.1 hypothetical protein MtrunA17_Chr5g0413501 [Medicago truncatula]
MSLQEQPMQQQQQQQPVQVYPTTVTYQYAPPEPDHHSSNGSFGSVFVVLAIIIVISAVACCLGRFCSRRGNGKSHSQKPVKHQKQQNHQHSRPKEVDIEFGFDKKIAASKPMNNGHGGFPKNNGHGGFSKNNGHGGVRVQKPVAQGHHDMKSFEIKLGPPQGKYRPGA